MFHGLEVAALLKNFTFERHLWSQEILQWSLPLVLSFLLVASFEPLKEASLEDLTRKTIFLVVLDSWRCFIEVHNFVGLLSAVTFSDTQDWVTMTI